MKLRNLFTLTKTSATALLLACSLSLLASCGGQGQTSQFADPPSEDDQSATSDSQSPEAGENALHLTMLTGPTGMGAAKLITDAQAGTTALDYTVEILEANDQVAALLTSGETDIAALSTSVAATLANKGVELSVLAVNTQGVLYLLEKGETITTLEDVAGKTIYATGQGANPEYILNALLENAGLTPGTDVTIEWLTAEEVAAKMVTEDAGICMLPVPATTALMLKDQGIREALNLNTLWAQHFSPVLPMGCVVVRTAFLQEQPQAVATFLEEYEASITYMLEEGGDQAQLIADLGITPSVEVATAALPSANIIFHTGRGMKADLELYYSKLFQADPASIGGGIPFDSFFYLGDD